MAEKFGDFGSSFGDNSTSNNDNFDSGFDTFDEISQEVLKSPLELKLQNAGLTQLEKVNFSLIEIPQEYLNNDLFINKLITLISNEIVLIDNKVLNKLLEQLIKEDKLHREREKGIEGIALKEEGIALKEEGIALKEEGIALKEESEALNNKKLEFFKLSDSLLKELNLESNPNYESWKQEATSNLLSSNPELKDNPEELESLVNSYILVENREELSKNNPELKDKLQSLANLSLKTEYSKVFENIFQSENSKVVDSFVNSQNGFTTVENDIVKASIIPDGNKAKIEGNNIVSYSGKTEDAAQIVELSETDLPKKFISKYGYKLETTQTFISDTNYQIKKQEYQAQYQQLDKDLKMSTDILNNILDQNTNALPDGEIRDNLDLYAANKAQLEGLDKNDELYELKKETLTTQIKEIEDKIKKEVLKIQQNIENINQEIQKISVSANNLQQEENVRLQNFKQLQVNADKKAEDTLDFLNNLGITNILQVDFEKLLTRLNKKLPLDPELNLANGFEGSLTDKNMQKEKIFNIFSKLYKKMGYNIETQDEIGNDEISNDEISNETQKLNKIGIINGKDNILKNDDFKNIFSQKFHNSNGLNFELLEETLLDNNKKKEKTPNKTIETL